MRQFDESLQRLGKILYNFFQEEKIESHHEKIGILDGCKEILNEGYMLGKCIQTTREEITQRINNEKTN